jgi:16S rRNA (cytosine967-C5)-methyltransferase
VSEVSLSPTVSTPALSEQLQASAQLVRQVLEGRSSTQALEGVPQRLRAGAQALGFATLRRLGIAQVLLELLARKKPAAEMQSLLWVALALLSDTGTHRYDEHTLVNQCVIAAKSRPGLQAGAGFINACLRRFLRERDNLLTQARIHLQAQWNHPAWWIQRMQKDHPRQWQTILEANLQKAPLVLRHATNTLTNRSPICSRGEPVAATQVGEFAWALDHALPVAAIDGFSTGAYSVQDSAAQLAAPLLLRALARNRPRSTSQAPWRILDACAAPGGKTVHLLEFARLHGHAVEVTALDISESRCIRIDENLRRGGWVANVRVADAGQPDTWWDGRPFDGILLDAPCTASGIVRRHPDVPWLRRESDIDQLARQQARLLDALWPTLAPQGTMLYCTCSVFRAEGDDQINAFLARNTAAALHPSPGHLLPGIPPAAGLLADNQASGQVRSSPPLNTHDGFFYAVLHNQSDAPHQAP